MHTIHSNSIVNNTQLFTIKTYLQLKIRNKYKHIVHLFTLTARDVRKKYECYQIYQNFGRWKQYYLVWSGGKEKYAMLRGPLVWFTSIDWSFTEWMTLFLHYILLQLLRIVSFVNAHFFFKIDSICTSLSVSFQITIVERLWLLVRALEL